MKQCPSCGEYKDESEFFRNKAQPTGYSYNCKRCDKIRSREYARKNKKRRDYMNKYNKKYRAEGYKNIRDKEKKRAHDKVRYALQSGKIKKPDRCSKCGMTVNVEAHHHDGYEIALNIIWLCRKCHQNEHVKII